VIGPLLKIFPGRRHRASLRWRWRTNPAQLAATVRYCADAPPGSRAKHARAPAKSKNPVPSCLQKRSTPPCARLMNFSKFLRVERDDPKGSRHYVIHVHDPKFSMELAPDGEAPNQTGHGVIKRICVPNSWAGDYTKYSKFITSAQEFFACSFEDPAPKAETKRFAM
jgi:hypothetical protein